MCLLWRGGGEIEFKCLMTGLYDFSVETADLHVEVVQVNLNTPPSAIVIDPIDINVMLDEVVEEVCGVF
jgi:hypothetical protein